MAGGTAVAEPEKKAAPEKEPSKSDTRDLSDEFLERRVTLRGIEYVLRELSQDEYDDCTKAATGKDGFDSVLLLKFMLAKALVSPRLTPDALRAKPFKVTNELRSIVNIMHWGSDETVEDDEGNELSSPAT